MNNTKYLLFLFALMAFVNCQKSNTSIGTTVTNAEELFEALSEVEPGSEVVMANGTWKDLEIKLYAEGTEDKPIVLRAQTPGKVIIEGSSDLKLGGKHLIVNGLYFKNGASPSRSVIQFFINQDTVASHCRVTNCVIEDFNKSQRNKQDLWVAFKGRHNQLDHCYLAGKSNRGPTIRVELKGNHSIKNYHKINHNHFGPRPPKGGPSAETIQIGNSSTSMAPSHTLVADNLFDRCNGEVEVISSKTNFNEFRNNVFYKSEGSLVTRHGNYCIVDGNYFIGDENSSNVGGVRLIGTGHWVSNNYFYNLSGAMFRAPLAIMNGIKKSALNRYIQVTDVVVAYNTYVNCKAPWQFGVGSNIDQKEVLPASEIRSETPIRTIVANNVLHNAVGDPMPIFRHDSIDGIHFKSNVINNQNVKFRSVAGLDEMEFSMKELAQDIWIPNGGFDSIEAYQGFEFDQISKDLFGNIRKEGGSIGATIQSASANVSAMDFSNYGPDWFESKPNNKNPKIHFVKTTEELSAKLVEAEDGDIIELAAPSFVIKSPLAINKKITIRSKDSEGKTIVSYTGEAMSPAFEMNPKGSLLLESIKLEGSNQNYAFASLAENMSSLYNLEVKDCDILNFDFVLKAYKYSFAEFISFTNTSIKNCNHGLELSGEDDDRGEYNAENISLSNCQFENVKQNVIDYYRGGYDESTVGGKLIVKGCSFSKCGAKEKNGILINTYGIINVDISDCRFLNNQVKYVARLWGAKNNSASNNTFTNSGKIISEQNLPLKLMY